MSSQKQYYMSKVNEQLYNLYSSKWDKLNSEIKRIIDDSDSGIKPTNPLLLQIDNEEDWKNADIRLMFFGKEPNWWGGECNEEAKPERPGINCLLKTYDIYFNKEGCWENPTPFFRGVGLFIELLQKKYPQPKKISLVWNNIIKIGKEGIGHPGSNIYRIEREYFSVIKDELKILKPNLVLFFTGHDYDDVIKDNFGEQELSKIGTYPKEEISKVCIDSVPFAFRTYHSGYLWRWRRNEIDDYFNEIIAQINF